ncbi:alpha/beta hydrolase [Marinilactibacillus psychrotolerans]|uniref:Alpha/beta hydrolase n=2 Tax=Marinilactibacillus psychrotolerans TaxID=191770 RepID=A0AAV3WTS0_9LACT|nr:alpha/beta hydrolase [Marinilactibacillus psychrotolerans]GEL67274.1 phospholipase/carboxylesterase [Marinilactibacillus psychrotolerans]GEQ32668.1 esterase [Marinilactibacillus psychrotolerans]GEQ36078.1 esterase [Marinilactibacillus psychrotolerans]SDC62685.1 phospholipase/carboxylesterase [Marinilactibacillus psychrotolerans]
MSLESFIHVYNEPLMGNTTVFLLLHGTGGDEHDMIQLAKMIDPQAGILSLRGNINENGMNRFFERKAMGILDEVSLKKETDKLFEFLNAAAAHYGFKTKQLVVLGYSNGANIASSLLFHYNDVLYQGMLLHPMVPTRNTELPDLSNQRLFIGAGENDPLCLPEETKELEQIFIEAGASITTYWGKDGHNLSKSEIDAAAIWYENL